MAPVRIERDHDVGVIIIDNPPINAGSVKVRCGLLAAVQTIDSDPTITAVVLIGAGATFVSGSDIKESGLPLQPPELPQVIAAIEASKKPFVAALTGTALGGGYELALACDLRIAMSGTLVGLPEVTLGMIPGAGGTQRLPRLVGAAKAIDLICTGSRVEVHDALTLGMIDGITKDQDALRGTSIAAARALGTRKRRISSIPVPLESKDALAAAIGRAEKAGKGRPAIAAAISSICSAVERPFDESLAAERVAFIHLREGPDAAALRYLFFAERQAARSPSSLVGRAFSVIGVVGAGTMGAGIAAALLNAGFTVILIDSAPASLDRGMAAIEDIVGRWRARGRLNDAETTALLARLTSSTALEALANCECVIEAIVEDINAKLALLKRLAVIVPGDALLATNTSYLDLDVLASSVALPERVLGLHFFNPAQVMRLVEVVQAKQTSLQTIADRLILARRMDKQAVVANGGQGFIGNRVYAAYRRHCEYMLEDGALPEQIDAAIEGFGFAMGPFATGDLSGLDIAWAMRKSQAATREPAVRYCAIPDRLCEAERFGRKTGKGYYLYPDRGRRGEPDNAVRAMIEAVAADNNIMRRKFEAQEIVARALGAIVYETALLIAEGVARYPSDVDVAFTNGFGFPRHKGGHYTGRRGRIALCFTTQSTPSNVLPVRRLGAGM